MTESMSEYYERQLTESRTELQKLHDKIALTPNRRIFQLRKLSLKLLFQIQTHLSLLQGYTRVSTNELRQEYEGWLKKLEIIAPLSTGKTSEASSPSSSEHPPSDTPASGS